MSVPATPLPVGNGAEVRFPLVVALWKIPVPLPIVPLPDREKIDNGNGYGPRVTLGVGSLELAVMGVALIVPTEVALLDIDGKPLLEPMVVALLDTDGLPEGEVTIGGRL